jgi:ribonuclease G
MPGRFLVFMPTVDHVGVSRKIDSREERSRLRGIVREFRIRTASPAACIIRTAASSRPKDDIVSDLSYFHKVWTEIRQKSESSPCAGGRLPRAEPRGQAAARPPHRGVLRHPHRQRAGVPPRLRADRAHHAAAGADGEALHKEYPIFEEYGVQAEIDKALRSKVWLKSGGSIVINQTEALVAIDVNTGAMSARRPRAARGHDLKTNLEAVKEIVRQIRLRDLGGIIVLDFIDMEEKKNRQKVFQAVEQELRKDRSPSKALQVSDFGLVIITRKRVKQSLERVLTEPCPYCAGSAVIKSTLDDLLRDPVGSEEDQRRPRRPEPRAPRQPGDRQGPARRGAGPCSRT